MNSGVDISKVVHVVFDAGQLRSIRKQSLHLGFCAAIPQLEVIEHGVVALGETGIGILD